jgi:hypothetical protein
MPEEQGENSDDGEHHGEDQPKGTIRRGMDVFATIVTLVAHELLLTVDDALYSGCPDSSATPNCI